MPAYLIVNITVHEPEAYEDYKSGVTPLVAKHGGEYLVRGGDHEVIEGEWSPTRLVLFSFPSRDASSAFFNDPDYLPLKDLRHRAATTEAVAVDGVD